LLDDPALLLFNDDRIALGTFDGLQQSPDRGCSWDFVNETLDGLSIYDLDGDPNDPARAIAVSSSGNAANRVFETLDGGETWASTEQPIAPSQPQRIYVSGSHLASEDSPRRPTVYRSDDGGATWTGFGVTLPEVNRTLFILAVSPTDPDLVVMKANIGRGLEGPERLYRSEDGGETWEEILSETLIPSAAFNEDGSTLWVAAQGTNSLYRSDDDARTLVPVETTLTVNCVETRGNDLWLCTENFLDGAAIHISDDSGASFRPMLDFQRDITGIAACAEGTPTPLACEAPLDDLVRDLGLADLGMFPDGGMSPMQPIPSTPPEGCGCAVPGSIAADGKVLGLFVALALALLGRRRR
jgi:photosystem II stability/assembly factor-like uncharacterized protein